MKIVAISDTHNQLYSTPYVDLLIHAGDLTCGGTWKEIEKAVERLASQPAKRKVAIAGNHDSDIQDKPGEARQLFKEAGIIYLEDEEVTIDGLRIYGSPWTPRYGEYAFMIERYDPDLVEKWAQIPEGIDILVTHGPPWGKFDVPFGSTMRAGDDDLMRELLRVKPRVHIFGHIHSPGMIKSSDDSILYINAAQTSTDRGMYNLVYEPVIFEL